MFDTFEIVNSNHLENRKIIRDLAEALTKNKNTNDAVFRDIFEKIEKNEEKNEHISKLISENMEKLALVFSQDHRIVKHVKRNLEDKAKVGDGNE